MFANDAEWESLEPNFGSDLDVPDAPDSWDLEDFDDMLPTHEETEPFSLI